MTFKRKQNKSLSTGFTADATGTPSKGLTLYIEEKRASV